MKGNLVSWFGVGGAFLAFGIIVMQKHYEGGHTHVVQSEPTTAVVNRSVDNVDDDSACKVCSPSPSKSIIMVSL